MSIDGGASFPGWLAGAEQPGQRWVTLIDDIIRRDASDARYGTYLTVP